MSGCTSTAHASRALSVQMTAVWPTLYPGCLSHLHLDFDVTYQDYKDACRLCRNELA